MGGMTNQAANRTSLAPPAAIRVHTSRTQHLLAAGGVLGALAASSCCVAPLVLFGLGVSGAWIANLTRLVIAAGGGYLALRLSGSLTGVFVALAVALCAFGLINAAAIAGGSWFDKPLRTAGEELA